MNPALTELTGYTVSDIPTRDVWEALAYREEAPRVKDDVRRAFEGGVPVDLGDHWVYTKSGDKRLWSVRRSPAGRDALGRRLLVGVALDITEHKKSEEDASAARSKLEAALSAMSDAVLISDAEGGFNHLNEAFAEFHKFKSKDETARSLAEYPELFDLFPSEWRIGAAGTMADLSRAARRKRDWSGRPAVSQGHRRVVHGKRPGAHLQQ